MLRLSARAGAGRASRVARVQRTTTTATLLVTVAVSALTGCVTVQRPLSPGPATHPSPSAEPRPVGQGETQVVQAPAREALEMIGPSRRSKASASPSRRADPGTRTPQRRTPADDARNGRPGTAVPDQDTPRRPPVDLPVPDGSTGSGDSDVCALGRQYGGWRADSPDAAVCRQMYGG